MEECPPFVQAGILCSSLAEELSAFGVRRDELVALSVDVDDFYAVVSLEVLAELGDIDIHGARVEIVVINPDGFQCEVTLQHFVGVCAEETEEFALFGGEFRLGFSAGKNLLLCVEGKGANLVVQAVAILLSSDTAQDGFDAEGEFLHGERLGQIVVSTNSESFKDVVFERLGGEEDDGHFLGGLSDVFGEAETVLLRHHDVEHAEVKFVQREGTIACFAVGAEFCVIAFCLKIFTKQHAEVFVVFAEEDSHFVFSRFHNFKGFDGEYSCLFCFFEDYLGDEREGDDEARAASECAFGVDGSSVCLNDVANVGEPESKSFDVVSVPGVDAIEFLEDFLEIFFSDSDSVVFNSDEQVVSVVLCGDGELQLSVRRLIFHRVVHEIEDDVGEVHFIDEDLRVLSFQVGCEVSSVGFHFESEGVGDVFDEGVCVEFFLFESGCFSVKHGHLQDFFHLEAQSFCFVHDDAGNVVEHRFALCHGGVSEHLCGEGDC